MAFGFRPIDCASHSVPFDPIRFHSSALFRSAPLCRASPSHYHSRRLDQSVQLHTRRTARSVRAACCAAHGGCQQYDKCLQHSLGFLALLPSVSQIRSALVSLSGWMPQLTLCRLGFSDLVHRLDPGVHKLFDYPFDSIPFGSIPSASRPSVALPVHRNESVRSSSKAKQSKAKQSKAKQSKAKQSKAKQSSRSLVHSSPSPIHSTGGLVDYSSAFACLRPAVPNTVTPEPCCSSVEPARLDHVSQPG